MYTNAGYIKISPLRRLGQLARNNIGSGGRDVYIRSIVGILTTVRVLCC